MTSNGHTRGAFARFFHSEASGGIFLLGATLIAMAWANSPWAESYFHLLHTKVSISWGGSSFGLSLHHWVNDGLMVVFFFVVGLEIKRELLVGRLSSVRNAVLPVAAALGGVVVPAALYAAVNLGGEGSRGWGVPMATDIAFALGILALLGKRVPIGLKIFLTALAIADDLGAVLVIALFYTEKILLGPLVVAAVLLVLIWLAGRFHARRLLVYLGLIVGVWAAVFVSGVHATVAGILVALLVPVRARIDPKRFLEVTRTRLSELQDAKLTRESMLDDPAQLDAIEDMHEATRRMRPAGLALEHHLHPLQAFVVLPIFALVNAGVPIHGGVFETLASPVSLGVVLGLVLGKQAGILLASWIAVRTGKASLPEGVTWPMVYGVSCLAGIGFTMSLFVGELAFTSEEMIGEAKIGILVASLLAAIWGTLVLWRSLRRSENA
jgi:NhaA family Na+:H+ antiporter